MASLLARANDNAPARRRGQGRAAASRAKRARADGTSSLGLEAFEHRGDALATFPASLVGLVIAGIASGLSLLLH